MWQSIADYFVTKIPAKRKSALLEKDRRRMERLHKVLTIICRDIEQDNEFTIVTENVNILGAKFITSRKPANGEILSLKIMISCHRNIEALGRTAWFKEKHINGKTCYEGGIEFMGMTKSNQKLFENYLSRINPDWNLP